MKNRLKASLCCIALLPLCSMAAVVIPEGPIISDPSQRSTRSAGETRYPVAVERGLFAAPPKSGVLALPSTDGEPLIARQIKVEQRTDGLHVWTAKVDTEAGRQSAVLVLGPDATYGLIPQRKSAPLRLETRQGKVWLVEGESALGRPDGVDFRLPEAPDALGLALRKKQEAILDTGTPRIDVVVMYNGELVAVWGSNAAVLTRIAYLESITNQAYVDSGADVRVKVVAAQLVDYSLRNDNYEALDQITENSALPIRVEALRLRAQYGADLVKLMRNFDRATQNSCGNGWLGGYHGAPFTQQYGFSVTSDHGYRNDNCGEWTFAHELGHNMGAHHDAETASDDYGAYTYSRGFRRTIDTTSGFATVMAYTQSPQVRLGRFSNPRQAECLGQPCGDIVEADNVRGFNEAGHALAAITPEIPASGLPTVSVSDTSVTEGNSGRRPAVFTISLNQAATGNVTLALATVHGSAEATDYVGATATLIIPAGQTAVTYSVDVRGDTVAERDEVFSLNILSAVGARVLDGQGVATIAKDDAIPTLNVADIELDEGSDGDVTATFTARLTHPSNTPVLFDAKSEEFSPRPDAATAGTDFAAVTLSGIRIEPGQTEAQISIPVFADTEVELDEDFLLILSNVSGAEVGDIFGWATLRNDDGVASRPRISVGDVSVEEGSAGMRDMNFPVTLSEPAGADVMYRLSAGSGTAHAGVDYVAPESTMLTIPAGQTAANARIQVAGDTLDESDEFFIVRLVNISGADEEDAEAIGHILDDDGSPSTPPLVARDDRFVVKEGSAATRLDVRANDASTTSLLSGGSLAITIAPPGGVVSVDANGTANTAADDTILYTPRAGSTGDDAFTYRLCESGGRCTEALVQVVRRPFLDVWIESATGAGFRDIEVSGLGAMPDARFQAVGAQYLPKEDLVVDVADATPESPWDGDGAGTAFRLATASSATIFPPDQWFGVQVDTRTRILADARSMSGGDIDLYMGVDSNRNGRPDPGEVLCTAAMSAVSERCELAFTVPADQDVPYWVMAHARTGGAQDVSLDVKPFQFEQPSTSQFIATGPGHPAAGDVFPVRLSWLVLDRLPGDPDFAYISVQDSPDAERRFVPVRLDRVGPAGTAMALPMVARVIAPAGQALDRLFVDVPVGATGMSVTLHSEIPVDLYLAKGPVGGASIVPAAPPRHQASAVRLGMTNQQALEITGAALTPGRWHVTPVNTGSQDRLIELRPIVTGAPVFPDFGSYYNPDRGGHGLFVYPAADQWAGLWYTYLQDGSATWYYLQGAEPETYNTGWTATVYRAAWNGDSNHLTPIGTASLTATGVDEVIFSYQLDGETGSERMVAFGSGCPTSGGSPVDASSHWFNPARAGTGYSVQLFPDYEFYAAFVYDDRGAPRFLAAERDGFGGADATLRLEQMTGFCPLCERTGNPARSDIGTLRRRYAGGTLSSIALDGVFTGGVPGAWTGDEPVQTLGGPGTTQGCAISPK